MKVKPNLYLNMSPQTTEEGGLAFARNMKLDDDGNLVSDYGYENISSMAGYNIVGHIVGLNDKIYFFCATDTGDGWIDEVIVEYDEITKTKKELNTEWTYNGGEIDGYVNTNQSGENILTIAEYKEGAEIPLKHINLSYPDARDESIYCQAPICPTANLVLKDTYVKTIPNGVYVFFIRYKIRKDVYTNWFLCSRPIFGGTSEKITTLQGGLSYINLHKDSAKSFVFQLDFAQNANIISYKEFQLGFIITHDEATDARTWKHFNISSFINSRRPNDDENLIYFDYENVEEANIDELLETTYELYNVRNVTSFKNKLYISNYKETNFNVDLQNLADYITLEEVHSGGEDVNYKNLEIYDDVSQRYIELSYNQNKGYYDYTKDGDIISSLLKIDSFNYNINKLSKTNSKEKKDVVKFDLIWRNDYNPDVAMIFNIYNYLYNKEIFGPDYADPYEFTMINGFIDEGLGIKFADGGSGNLWCYRRSTNKHPWDDLGLTFGFGSFSEGDAGKEYARQGCSYFNQASYEQWGAGSSIGWVTRDSGFTDAARSAMINKLKEDIANKSFWGKAYIEITSGAKTYTIGYDKRMDLDNYAGYNYDDNNNPIHDIIPLSNDLFSTDVISDPLLRIIKQYIYFNVCFTNNFRGIDENGTLIINLDGEDIRVNTISIKFKKFDFSLDVDDIESTEGKMYKNFRVTLTTTDYVSLCTFNIKSSMLSVSDTVGAAIQASTLMPLSTYQPYVHFVDEHNIITNGIKLPQFTTRAAESDKDIITLNYTISNLPTNKYKSCFISLVNVGDIIIEGFDYTKDPNDNNVNILHSIELDSMLYNLNDNITIKGIAHGAEKTQLVPITDEAKYYSSGSNYPPLAFGNCGFVSWTGAVPSSVDKLYIVVSRNKSSENIDKLIKASGYLPLVDTDSTPLHDGYYGSWLCLVKKPSFTLSSSCYVSGKDVYAVDRTTSLSLTEFKSYIQVQDSVTYFVHSNFNLNYLSLTEEITDSIFSVGSASSGVKQVAKVINSAILSFIYELKSMYRDFSNKYFRCKEDYDYKIQFDNTVRVSNVLSDETFNNSVFKFASEDYYNVPTNRGVIVNLFSIGNNIFVHCKGSLYKFDGNATIAANDKDIQLQSAEPFNAGISQIIDSEYGYGGIATKQAGCITFDSYFFYDQASNHILAYGGNSQIQLIDGNIYKLLAYYKPSECKTLHDEANCRVLFEFTSGRSEHEDAAYKTFTLSYNYKTKTFVSFHDISLVNAFASRHKAYSYKSVLINLFNIENGINTSPLVEGMNVNQIFGEATTACIIEFGSKIYKKQASPFGIAIVLLPQANLKETVDSVKYVADIQQLDPETQTTPIYDVLVNPQVTRNNPVVNFYIITDSCVSSLVTTNVDDTARPNSLLDYKGFKYDMGFWTSNYFRNNINKVDIYNYGKKYPNRALDIDNNSLVYGRYFIFVFDFKPDTPIKFEDIYMNTNKY